MEMRKKELVKRYVVYVLGVYVLAMGLAMIITSTLGTSPISSWSYVMSCNTPLSVGTYTFIINMALIAGQFMVLRHHGLRRQAVNIGLQIPFSFMFSAFIDFNIWLLKAAGPTVLHPFGESALPLYAYCVLLLALGCFIQSVGVLLEVKAGVTMMSGEAFVYYICTRWSKEFGKVKVTFDVVLVLLAVISSVGFSLAESNGNLNIDTILKGLFGAVREGTIVAALSVGQIVRLLAKHSAWIDKWCMK
ncbi:MAG: hypothetical protein NC206_02465 [Bacteroides sp.]|nr:YitT family protein [Roseburia sp.]MCM1345927.1 hypothetical protein [Bacteroides sp.]MCM1420092.1 hypothetical protein [Bacteroides sp.]